MRSAITLGIGILIAAFAPGARAQSKPATPAGAKPAAAATKPPAQAAQPAAKPAAKPAAPAAKPAPQTSKPAAQPAMKTAATSAAKPAVKAPRKPASKSVERPASGGVPAAAESEVKQARRDPFESLVNRQQAQAKAMANLPPGKAGLQVSTLRLDGIVKSPNGMIAVVSNPQARTYFLREGDHLYDGSVEKISMDGVSFHEEGKDAFGKPVERQVNKRIYSSPGEQQ
jgi:Tfp pilus assembly protein PilP